MTIRLVKMYLGTVAHYFNPPLPPEPPFPHDSDLSDI